MNKISLLIFSRNDIDKAWGLVEEMKDFVQEIVLMDSSDVKLHNALLKMEKPGNLRIYKVPALGYPDPLRMYGLSKCKNDWVFLLDTDERLGEKIKQDLNKIINTEISAFSIRRYEYATETDKGGSFTWQTRLFRKSKIIFRGLVHEQPLVNGGLKKLGEEYYIEHRRELKTGKTSFEYSKIERFDRLSYKLFKERMMEYMAKGLVREVSEVKETGKGRFVYNFMDSYQRIKFKDDASELSSFDYFIYCYLKNLPYYLKTATLRENLELPFRSFTYMRYVDRLRKAPEGDEDFEISKIINKIGITKFLMLDRESTIKKLNRERIKSQSGINLLIYLLRKRYREIANKRQLS